MKREDFCSVKNKKRVLKHCLLIFYSLHSKIYKICEKSQESCYVLYVTIISQDKTLISTKNIRCGYSLEAPRAAKAFLSNTCFREKK